MNKKAQLDFGMVTFIVVVITILILAPILIHLSTTILSEVGTNLNNTNEVAGQTVLAVNTSFTNLWDWVILLLFALNVILLLITSFFIDTHPAFMLLYIIFAFFLVVFTPSLVDVVDSVYAQYSTEVGLYLPLTEFLVNNFTFIVYGLLILSGIIIYAKIKYFGTQY